MERHSRSKDWQKYIPPIGEMTPDERWMMEALKEAHKAYSEGEVPVGAVVVYQGQCIARGHNQVELLKDATAHAEMLAIGAASEYLSGWRLEKCTLYTTLEPCVMCSGALLLSRVERVVWGAPDLRHGANGSLIDIFSIPHPTHTCVVERAVLGTACGEIMKMFFREQREHKGWG